MNHFKYSYKSTPISWPDSFGMVSIWGNKGATLDTLPRKWTPAFMLVSAEFVDRILTESELIKELPFDQVLYISNCGNSKKIIVRSSIVNESIWERGTYESVVVDAVDPEFEQRLCAAILQVKQSACGRSSGLVVQNYIEPLAKGDFGNLIRVSKTRDQWELTSEIGGQTTTTLRFNSQRDVAADIESELRRRARQSEARLFASIAAWLNNELVVGRPDRLTCEWIAERDRFYLVQIDEEDEDTVGINPLQLRVSPVHQPEGDAGSFFRSPNSQDRSEWDKLKVLEELWEDDVVEKPMLFFSPIIAIKTADPDTVRELLVRDFQNLIGPDGIVIRTSIRCGCEKQFNLPRSECLSPDDAADWCIAQAGAAIVGVETAFVAHRFIASRASAWARAEPGKPYVEIHSLWGLPDALQYCPHDTWEVHLPTETPIEYPDYKPVMLLHQESGDWEYARIKNEVARGVSIGRRDAIEIARRTAAIAERMGHACHVMWFVGCTKPDEANFNVPWYWTEAHETEKNIDRTNYEIFHIKDKKSLKNFKDANFDKNKTAMKLLPDDIDLMRDVQFISDVGLIANNSNVPVILDGSTLGHAYFQLRRIGCTVITPREKSRDRIRQGSIFGKLVRDKIPEKIRSGSEVGLTRKIPRELVRGFLVSKLLEEILEVRDSSDEIERLAELGDLFEVVRALSAAYNLSLRDISNSADAKKEKLGGFDEGLILLKTGLPTTERSDAADFSMSSNDMFLRGASDDSFDIPFTFFGFMAVGSSREIAIPKIGKKAIVTLMDDRIRVVLSDISEQIPFSFS